MKHNKLWWGGGGGKPQPQSGSSPDGLQSEQHLALASSTKERLDAVERLMKTESISIFTQNEQDRAGQG